MSSVAYNIVLEDGAQRIQAQVPVGDTPIRQSREFFIDRRLGSGNLADVFALRAVESEREVFDWVIKIGPRDFTEQELDFLQRHADHLAPVLPRCGVVESPVPLPGHHLKQPGQQLGAVLLERIEPEWALRRVIYEEALAELEREYVAWQMALAYARFVARLHQVGFSSNDRKLDDFYIIGSLADITQAGRTRLLVLDWNVIEPIAGEGVVKRDLLELADAWRRLFRAGDEVRLDDPGLGHVSLAGQGWLWRALNGSLSHATDQADFDADVIRSLEVLLEEFTTVTPGPVRPAVDKGKVSVAMPLDEIDLVLLPTWQRIDLLLRRSELPPHSPLYLDLAPLGRDYSRTSLLTLIDEIRTFRREAYQYANHRVGSNLHYSHLALREIRALRKQRSEAEQQALLDLWEQIIQWLEHATQGTVAAAEVSDWVTRYTHLLAEYAVDPSNLAYFRENFQALLVEGSGKSLDRHLLRHLETLLAFVNGQLALTRQGLEKAETWFETATMYLAELPAHWQMAAAETLTEEASAEHPVDQTIDLQHNAKQLLPADPAQIAAKLADLRRQWEWELFESVRELIRTGQFEQAIERAVSSQVVPEAIPGFIQIWLHDDLMAARYALQLRRWIAGPSSELETLEQVYTWAAKLHAYCENTGMPRSLMDMLQDGLEHLKAQCVRAAQQAQHDVLMVRRAYELGTRIQDLSMRVRAES